MLHQNNVDDKEKLYRRVPNDPALFPNDNGKMRFSASAFNDVGQKPSVDRAVLRNSPEETKNHPSDGIICLLAEEIRAIKTVKNQDAESGEPVFYYLDVIARPIPKDNPQGLPENESHAQIETSPVLRTSSRFKKVKEALALLATQKGWLIEPSEA